MTRDDSNRRVTQDALAPPTSDQLRRFARSVMKRCLVGHVSTVGAFDQTCSEFTDLHRLDVAMQRGGQPSVDVLLNLPWLWDKNGGAAKMSRFPDDL